MPMPTPEPGQHLPVCPICAKPYTGWGNNPDPVIRDVLARCCDTCNWKRVIPARMERFAIALTN